jgi:hypothetical protein
MNIPGASEGGPQRTAALVFWGSLSGLLKVRHTVCSDLFTVVDHQIIRFAEEDNHIHFAKSVAQLTVLVFAYTPLASPVNCSEI